LPLNFEENKDAMKEMKRLFGLVLGYSLVTAFPFAQDRSTPVSLIELIAHVEKFDNQLVTVQGFLRITHERKHGVRANLYLHEEDAKNLLNNDVLVMASQEMLRDEEKIDRKYMILTGSFRAVHGAGNVSYEGGLIKNVRSCTPWSDPNRPIGNQNKADGMVK